MSPPDSVALLSCPSADDYSELSRALEGLQVQVLHAVTPAEAIHFARHNCFVLIVLDLDSDSAWRTTVEALRRCAPGAGLIAYSRLPDEKLWIDALEAGASDFLCKPFLARELQWVFESVLRSRLPVRRPVTAEVRALAAAKIA